MSEPIEFMHARVVAMDKEIKKYRHDRAILLSTIARLVGRFQHLSDYEGAMVDFAKMALNHEVTYHENSLIKYEWSYDSVPVQNDEHQG